MVTIYPGTRNFIKRRIQSSCATPWWIWVETFFPSFIKLILVVSLLDFNDAVRARGKKITSGHKMRSGRGRGGKRRIRVFGIKIEIERWQQKGLRTLLVVTQPLEFIGLAWLLYAATDNFFYDWQTLVEDSGYCTRPEAAGPLTRRRNGGFISIVEGGVPIILDELVQNRAGWSTGFLSAGLPFGRYTAVLALSVIGPLFGASGIWIQLRSTFLAFSEISRSEEITVAEGEEADLTVSHDFFYATLAGGALTWEIGGVSIPIGINTTKGFMSVFKHT